MNFSTNSVSSLLLSALKDFVCFNLSQKSSVARMSRLSYSNPGSSTSVTLNIGQELVGVGCGSNIEVIRLGVENVLESSTLQLKSSGRFTVTDCAFSPLDRGMIAASATNGMLSVLDVHANTRNRNKGNRGSISGASKSKMMKWDSMETSRSINKISWHPEVLNVLLSSSMDGLIRLFDIRTKGPPQGVYNPRADACRDVHFNPFQTHQLAAITENGSLSLWDDRMADKFLYRINAHTMPSLSLAWNPSQPNIVATGSRDRTVKVWDITTFANDADGSLTTTNTTTLDTTTANSTAHSHVEPLHTIHTPSAVGRIRWRKTARFSDQLATISSSASERGDILIWKVGMPNIPACVLQGHDIEGCADFQWLDTPAEADYLQKVHQALADRAKNNTSEGNSGTDRYLQMHDKVGQILTSPDISKTQRKNIGSPNVPPPIPQLGSPKFSRSRLPSHSGSGASLSSLDKSISRSDHGTFDMDGSEKEGKDGAEDTSEDREELRTRDPDDYGVFLNVYQHVLSVGKNGTMLVQDVRNGYFPRQHISPCVTAISSQGHVAFQRGEVMRGDVIGLLANQETQEAPGYFRDVPSKFGMAIPEIRIRIGGQVKEDAKESFEKKNDQDDEKEKNDGAKDAKDKDQSNKSQEKERKDGQEEEKEEQMPSLVSSTFGSTNEGTLLDTQQAEIERLKGSLGTGVVYCGLAEIKNLVEAAEIRNVRGAEGGVFDPAVVSLLARTYKLGIGEVGLTSALKACAYNLAVAHQSGLQCRAAVWSSVWSLLSSFSTDTSNGSNNNESKIVFDNSVNGISDLPTQLPFTLDILGNLLQELLEGGDCQHFVVVCEVLKCAEVLEPVCDKYNITVLQRREIYLAYFDLLAHLKLFTCANDIIKASDEKYISRMSRQGVLMYTSCSSCGKEIQENQSRPWCNKCKTVAVSCSLCHQPVLKMLHWCPVCGHGGHIECIMKWFSMYSTCPSGCGHRCYESDCHTKMSLQPCHDKVESMVKQQIGTEGFCANVIQNLRSKSYSREEKIRALAMVKAIRKKENTNV